MKWVMCETNPRKEYYWKNVSLFTFKLYYILDNLVLCSDHEELQVFGNSVLNSLPNDKILDWSKFKTFADDIFNVAKMMISVCDRVENIEGKGEIARYQHFFPQCFQFFFILVLLKLGIMW